MTVAAASAGGTISLALLGTPALGLLISAAALAEPVTLSLIVGTALIGAGICAGAVK